MAEEAKKKVKADIWMPLYIGDYLRDTMHLTTEQHGAYLLLIMAAWTRGGVLPADPTALANIARVGPQRWVQVGPAIADFFKAENGKWVHSRIQLESIKANKTKEKRQEAGKYAAEKRWESHTNRIPIASASDTPSPSPSPSPSKKEQRSKISCPIDFEKFWDIYPKKEGKGAAKKAYEKAISAGASPETLLAAVALAKDKSDKWRDGFIPMPTTWLNQERWEDEFNPSVIEGRIKRSPGGEAAQRVLESIRASNGGGNNGQNRGADV